MLVLIRFVTYASSKSIAFVADLCRLRRKHFWRPANMESSWGDWCFSLCALFCWKMMIIATRHHRRMRYRCPDVSWMWTIHGVITKKNIMHEGGPTDSATIQPVRSSDVPKTHGCRCPGHAILGVSQSDGRLETLGKNWKMHRITAPIVVWWSLMVIDLLQMSFLLLSQISEVSWLGKSVFFFVKGGGQKVL